MPIAASGCSHTGIPVCRKAQQGMILPIALVFLVAATLLSLGFIRTNNISLRIGGASVVAEETQAVAELLQSNFFSRNPVDASAATLARYQITDPVCGTAAQLADAATTNNYFDCRQIADSRLRGAAAQAPVVQRIGCGNPPRSSVANEVGKVLFNYYHVVNEANNSAFGSNAQVGAGVSYTILGCPPAPGS